MVKPKKFWIKDKKGFGPYFYEKVNDDVAGLYH
jgi:hypothetical protein